MNAIERMRAAKACTEHAARHYDCTHEHVDLHEPCDALCHADECDACAQAVVDAIVPDEPTDEVMVAAYIGFEGDPDSPLGTTYLGDCVRAILRVLREGA